MNAWQTGASRLAHAKAAAKPLRLFAQRLAIDQIESQKRFAILAKHLKLDVASSTDRPPPELLTTIGSHFDHNFLALVIKGQQDLISLYESEASGGQDRRAKHFAHEAPPMLRLHLKEIKHSVARSGYKAEPDGR